MSCSFPPPLSDDQISMALEGQIDPAVQEHLARCAGCRLRLEEARTFETKLSGALYRWDCPTPSALGDYHLGLLSADESQRVLRHVEGCPHCAAELAALRIFLAAREPNPAPRPGAGQQSRPERRSLGRRLREAVASLAPASPQGALRGLGSGPVVLRTASTTIFLEAQPDTAGPALVGQLIADQIEQWAGSLVEMHQKGSIQATTTLDDLGGFRCGPLLSAPVSLHIVSPSGRSIAIFDVSVES